MKQIATISFADHDSGDEAAVIVRATAQVVGLAITLRRDGDIETFFGLAELDRLLEALQTARRVVVQAV